MKNKYRIYTLAIYGNVFYVGVTKLYLHTRHAGHLANNSHTRKKIGKHIECSKIEEIDHADNLNDALVLEAYWIHQLRSGGFYLINVNHNTPNSNTPKIAYYLLNNAQCEYIRKYGCWNIGKIIGKDRETVRLFLNKKRIKYAYFIEIDKYLKISLLNNLLNINTLNINCNIDSKI